jgi:hypothetical protein
MDDIFSALTAFTEVFPENINKQATLMMLSLFPFLNAFVREENRYTHMKIIGNFCIDILLHQIKTANLNVAVICCELLFQIQYQISLKLKAQHNGHFQDPFGPQFYIFRKNVNDLIDLIQYLRLENPTDMEINYDYVMLSRNIKNSLNTFLESTLNICNVEGVRAQKAMPNVLTILESM